MEVWVNEALALFERNLPRSEALYTLYHVPSESTSQRLWPTARYLDVPI